MLAIGLVCEAVSGCTLKPGAWLGSGVGQGFESIPKGAPYIRRLGSAMGARSDRGAGRMPLPLIRLLRWSVARRPIDCPAAAEAPEYRPGGGELGELISNLDSSTDSRERKAEMGQERHKRA